MKSIESKISDHEKTLLELTEELKYLVKEKDELNVEKYKIEKKQVQL